MILEGFKKPGVALLVTFCIGLISALPVRVFAAPIPSLLANGKITRQSNLEEVRNAINTRVVANRLQALGLAPAEIEARISLLPDHELAMLADKAETINHGGVDILGFLLVLIILGAFIFLALELSGESNWIRSGQ